MINLMNIVKMGVTMVLIMVTLGIGWLVFSLPELIKPSAGLLATLIGWATWTLTWGFTLAAFGFIAMVVCLIPALIPVTKLQLITLILCRFNDRRAAWAQLRPHVEVLPHSYYTVFDFEKRLIGPKFWIVDYQFPVYQGSIRPEVLEWCDAMLRERPQLSPKQVTPDDVSGVRRFLVFSTPNDAMAFKLRWL
jgi:hypothetical protein